MMIVRNLNAHRYRCEIKKISRKIRPIRHSDRCVSARLIEKMTSTFKSVLHFHRGFEKRTWICARFIPHSLAEWVTTRTWYMPEKNPSSILRESSTRNFSPNVRFRMPSIIWVLWGDGWTKLMLFNRNTRKLAFDFSLHYNPPSHKTIII